MKSDRYLPLLLGGLLGASTLGCGSSGETDHGAHTSTGGMAGDSSMSSTGGSDASGGTSSTGGAASGGSDTGGASTGGTNTGGSGGVATGGTGSGGEATGGTSTGGTAMGGAGSGGEATGGSGTGGSPPVVDTDDDGVPDDEDACPDGQPSTTVFGPGCECAPGYDGSVVSETCEDIDECASNNGGCGDDDFWLCADNDGAAPTCSDIDECATDNGGCGSATFFTCANNEGAAPACKAKPQATERVNVSSDEEQGGLSDEPAVSGNGRFVAFSASHNYVSTDTNFVPDVYLRDLETGTTELVSQSSSGALGNNDSGSPSISHDGRFVAFASRANTLAGTDNTITDWDVFVRDRQLGTTERISVSTAGVSSNSLSNNPQISADGRYVVFTSRASNLTADTDANGNYDVFLRDRELGTTTLVSVSMTPSTTGIGESSFGSVSSDGRYVAFQSVVNTLVAGDTNVFGFEVFVRDMVLGTTTLISKSTAGVLGNAASSHPSISADGGRVVFHSYSDTLVTGDTNALGDIFVRDMTLGTTERVSLSYLGLESLGGHSDYASISGDGNLVVFRSLAANLVPENNNVRDVFVRDLAAGTTERVSISWNGQQANGTSCNSTEFPGISYDGSVAVFSSLANNLVTGDTNGQQDIFIRRR